MPRTRKSRIYWRNQGGVQRAYADLRDLGHGRIPLVREGDAYATTDPDTAASLLVKVLAAIKEQRSTSDLLGIERTEGFEAFAAEHLKAKAEARDGGLPKFDRTWLRTSENHLREAMEFLREIAAGRAGSRSSQRRLRPLMEKEGDVPVRAVTVEEVEAYSAHLKTVSNGRGGTISDGVQRQYLNSLSNLFRRAQSKSLVPPGYNPVAAMMDKPTAKRPTVEWYEVPDAALILEACRVWTPKPDAHAVPFLYPLVATFFLAGGRRNEVFCLEVSDILFKRRRVRYQSNVWYPRRKTVGSEREVPLWPQLAEVLEEYLEGPHKPKGRLLFPSPRFVPDPEAEDDASPLSKERPLDNVDNALDAVAELLEMEPRKLRCKPMRHTYCTTRLQTVEPVRTPTGTGWVDVARDTVARELGHGGTKLVQNVYGHLPEHRHRSETVEYRLEHWKEELGERVYLVRPQLRIA